MSTTPVPMLLQTKFDIEQVSDLLAWRFVRSDHEADPDHGKEAGIINFSVGETFLVQIKGGSRKRFEGFRVIDCCLVTRPYIFRCGPGVPTVYAPPSPFAAQECGAVAGAIVQIPGADFAPRVVEQKHHYHEVAQDWTGHLTVGSAQGRWEMSFIVTVEITKADGSTYLRVFSFDPETEVTPGTYTDDMMEPELQPAMASLMPETDPGSGTL